MSFKDKHPIGSEGWFKGEEQFGARGSIATCIQLLLQEEISFAKCMELLRIVIVPWNKGINWEVDIKAPWEKLDWNAEIPGKEDIETLQRMISASKRLTNAESKLQEQEALLSDYERQLSDKDVEIKHLTDLLNAIRE